MKSTCLLLGAITAAKANLFEDIEGDDRQLQQQDYFDDMIISADGLMV